MQFVEEPCGHSMFRVDPDSFGLGYIIPAFVCDDSLSKHRWKPWAAQKESERTRRADASYDAVVYAMLGAVPTPHGQPVPLLCRSIQDKYRESREWNLPLLRFGENGDTKNAFTFMRCAFADSNVGWVANSRAFLDGQSFTSLKKLMEGLDGNTEAVAAIRAEAAHFFGVVCDDEGTLEIPLERLMHAHSEWFYNAGGLRDCLNNLAGFADNAEAHVKRLEQRAVALSKLSRAALAKHFASVG